jgi:DNA-binding HxlR family transcriptional regulator
MNQSSPDIDQVRDAIRDEPRTTSEIQRLTGLNDNRMFDALDALEQAGLVKITETRSGRGRVIGIRYRLASTEVPA